MAAADRRGRQMTENRQLQGRERMRLRQYDVEDSRNLLLELALYEPNITHCFRLITNACLTEDIDIEVKGQPMSDLFKRYVNVHYHSFCTDAIKCMFIYGFVPWYPRKLPSGDIVPMTLPHGTFTWSVRGRNEDDYGREQKKPKKATSHLGRPDSRWAHLPVPETENGSKLVQHQVRLTHADIDPDDVQIFDVVNADLHISKNSNLFATVPSPLAHILSDYRNIREAQTRRSYADAWNTTARIFTSCIPPNSVSNEPTHSYLYYETGTDTSRLNQGRNYMQSRHRELEQQMSQPSNHIPSLYNLPVHHRLEQLHALSPCEDLPWLLDKYRRDVTSLLGIPFEVAYGRSGGGLETMGQSETNSRVFSNSVLRICHTLEELVRSVYAAIYECDIADVLVTFNPMPRLDVHSMDDLKTLWEIGAVTPDVTAQLSEILLLGERTNLTGRKRRTTHKDNEYLANLKNITEASNVHREPNNTTSGAQASGSK
eukprot:1177177-Rhodomonas_salina.4